MQMANILKKFDEMVLIIWFLIIIICWSKITSKFSYIFLYIHFEYATVCYHLGLLQMFIAIIHIAQLLTKSIVCIIYVWKHWGCKYLKVEKLTRVNLNSQQNFVHSLYSIDIISHYYTTRKGNKVDSRNWKKNITCHMNES